MQRVRRGRPAGSPTARRRVLREAVAASRVSRWPPGGRSPVSTRRTKQSRSRPATRTVPRTGRAGYVLGSDGSTSLTRRAIGVSYEGSTDSRTNFSMVFRVARSGRAGPARSRHPLLGARPRRSRSRRTHGPRRHLVGHGHGGRRRYRPRRPHPALFGRSSGPVSDDIEMAIVSTDPWTARMLNASAYGTRRVFLVGDAAHLNPPWGGHGFNTAVGDAVNIGWKLAAVLQGWGGEALLPSYEQERKPIAQQTIDLATSNMSQLSTNFADPPRRSRPDGDTARADIAARVQIAKDGEFHSLGLVLGYHYGDSPVIVADGTSESPTDPSHYEPTRARCPAAASVAPQRAVGLRRARADLTLLCLDPEADPSPFVIAASSRGTPLHVLDLCQLGCTRTDLVERYGATMLLVRPTNTSLAVHDNVSRRIGHTTRARTRDWSLNRGAIDHTIRNSRSPVGVSSVISTPVMSARGGPSRHHAISSPTASRGPSATTSTEPSLRLRTQPRTPSSRRDRTAGAAVVHALNPTRHDHSTAHLAHATMVTRPGVAGHGASDLRLRWPSSFRP